MLRDLYVRNLAVIAEVTLQFGAGLNVLTGETGAGKSIVVDSLALLAGVRASGELIRTDADALSVTGVFEPVGEGWRDILSAAGVEVPDGELTVRREVSREGRNRVFLNDRLVTLGLLAQIAPHLLRIHTQREELGLVSPELQRAWLDRSGGNEAAALCQRVREAFEEHSRLASRLERAQGDERLRLERIDLLRFQAGEIDAARLQPGEEERLRQEREVLRHSEAIAAALGASHGWLFEDEGAAIDRVTQAARGLAEVVEWEPDCASWLERLQATRLSLEELTRDIQRRLQKVEADPGRLDALEERLAVVERLCRKYGQTSADVLAYRQEIGQELEEVTGDEEQRESIARQASAALERYRLSAAELSRRRYEWAERLADRVHRELRDLAMAKARFAVRIGTRPRDKSPLVVNGLPVDFSASGYDQVSYLLAANPGEEPTSLSRSASGGELSRVYLAVQLAIRDDGPAAAPTLVFDEVDAGIGGAQAAALGHKLERLSEGGQILVVTHLPQVASHADRHFMVRKRVVGGRTLTEVEDLDQESRVGEVARMLAGKKVTALSRSHAEELIATASRKSK